MKKIVVIMGAGSSSDFGYPLGNEFYKKAYNILKTHNDIYCGNLEDALREVEAIINRLYIISSKDKIEYPLFEEVITFIWNCGDILFNEKRKQEIFNSFIEMMCITFCKSFPFIEKKYYEKATYYNNFIQSLLKSGDDINFISLNYDIMLDVCLKKAKEEGVIKDFNYGAVLYDIETQESLNKGDTIKILKPHGSLNMAYCKICEKIFYHKDHIYSAIINKRDWCKCPFCNNLGEDSCVEPLIIPPMYAKLEFINKTKHIKCNGELVIHNEEPVKEYSAYREYRDPVDANIIKILNNVSEIIVIGYSLPPYDYDFRNLLHIGLIDNKNRKEVPIKIITKKDHKELKHKYRNLTGNVEIIGNRGFLEYIKNQCR